MAPVQAERAVRRLTLHENRGKGGKKNEIKWSNVINRKVNIKERPLCYKRLLCRPLRFNGLSLKQIYQDKKNKKNILKVTIKNKIEHCFRR